MLEALNPDPSENCIRWGGCACVFSLRWIRLVHFVFSLFYLKYSFSVNFQAESNIFINSFPVRSPKLVLSQPPPPLPSVYIPRRLQTCSLLFLGSKQKREESGIWVKAFQWKQDIAQLVYGYVLSWPHVPTAILTPFFLTPLGGIHYCSLSPCCEGTREGLPALPSANLS